MSTKYRTFEPVSPSSWSSTARRHAFCVVTSHGQGADGAPIFVVARAAEILEPQDDRGEVSPNE